MRVHHSHHINDNSDRNMINNIYSQSIQMHENIQNHQMDHDEELLDIDSFEDNNDSQPNEEIN